MQKRYLPFVLAIIPFVYLITGFHFNHLNDVFSLRNLDPEYIYFMSGLGISNGHIHIGHIDNPGSPLQYLVAFTFRFMYLFRPDTHPFTEDVVLNSDYYLNMVNHFLLVIVAVSLYFIGRKVQKTSKNLAYALLIQTAPFYSEIIYDIIGRVVPELLTAIPILLFSMFFLKLIFTENQEFRMKDIIVLALIAGLGLSIKLNFITMWVIPLFILPGIRKKIYFIGLSIVAFFLIALPVTFEINTFYVWVKNLIIHTGSYGKGDASFIDWNSFAENMKTIWASTRNLFYFLALTGISAILFYFRKKTEADKRLFLISIGICVSILLQVLLVSKHYSYRYLIPSLAFLPMLMILSFEMISRIFPSKWNKQIILIIALVGFVPGIKMQRASAQLRTLALNNEMDAKRETWFRTQALEKDSYKIIVSQGYGAPFQDYAIMYSTCWAGVRYFDYTELLGRLYPDTYQYFTWDNTVKTFGPAFIPDQVMESKKPVFLYLENDTPEMMQKTMDKMFLPDDSVTVVPNQIYRNEQTNEGLYSLQLSSNKKQTLIP